MWHDLAFALWFFIPAGVANVTPILAAHIPGLRKWDYPVDGHKVWRGKRLLGDHKTYRGFITGITLAIVTIYAQAFLVQHISWLHSMGRYVDYGQASLWLLGFLFGFGALAGDAIESFFKRRFDIHPGHGWFPFDQIDYIIGGAIAAGFLVRLPALIYVYVLLLWLVIHLGSSYLGWLLHLKDSPI